MGCESFAGHFVPPFFAGIFYPSAWSIRIVTTADQCGTGFSGATLAAPVL